MLDQAVAPHTYSREHGRSWKTRLWVQWTDATADLLLHRLRNTHGPAWLDRLKLTSLPAVSEEENHVGQC